MTGETTAFTSLCKLHKGRNGIHNYDTHIITAHNCLQRQNLGHNVIFQRFLLSRYFNQLDTTSKVIYGLVQLKNNLCADNDVTM